MLPDFSVSRLWCADAATPPTPIPAYCCCPFVLLLLLPDLSVFRTYVCRIFSPVATKRDYMSASRESSSNAPKKLFPRDLCLSLPLPLPQNAIMSTLRERVTSSCLSENHDKLTAVVGCASPPTTAVPLFYRFFSRSFVCGRILSAVSNFVIADATTPATTG